MNIMIHLPTKKVRSKRLLFSVGAFLFFGFLAGKVFAQLPNVYQQVSTVQGFVSPDIDGDGMPNVWELQYGLDPADPTDAAGDLDGDSLLNLDEYLHGTDPTDPDTDNGGVTDYHEIQLNKDPLDPSDDFTPITFRNQPEQPNDPRADSDGDGVPNPVEREYGTDIHDIDTDDDGVNDYDEIFKYRTNPLDPDTDRDGLTDGQEIFTYSTDPKNRDTDFDGLTDYEEIFEYKTNPSFWDTDFGGMSDFDEVVNGSNPLLEDDDFQFTWIIYYGNEANELFKILENNKINIYEGMNLTLEAVKPLSVKSMTVEFNDKGFTTEKELVKLKVLAPDKPGIYLVRLTLELHSGQLVKMTRFVEVRQRGVVIRKASGTFNNVYRNFDFFDDEIVSDARVEVFTFNDIQGNLEKYETDLFPIANPQYTSSAGNYLLALHPGNYLVKVSKPELGTKEILLSSDGFELYSQNIYMTYNYDPIIWGGIFIAIFTVIWYLIAIYNFIRRLINNLIRSRVRSGRAY